MDYTLESLIADGRYFAAFINVLAGLLASAVYFLPSIVAAARNVATDRGVYLLNFLLGWTFLG